MAKFETMVPKRQSEVFNTAVFRFLETQPSTTGAGPVPREVSMSSEPRGDADAKVVTLWNDDAVRQFSRFWAAFPKRGTLGPV